MLASSSGHCSASQIRRLCSWQIGMRVSARRLLARSIAANRVRLRTVAFITSHMSRLLSVVWIVYSVPQGQAQALLTNGRSNHAGCNNMLWLTGVSPAQDKAAFGSVVLTAAAEAPSVAARLVGHPKRSPQLPSEPQMPHLPRLQTGHASPATVTSAHGPTLSSSSAAESGATAAPWHTQTWLGQQQMPQSRGGDALSEKPERSTDLSSGQPGGPYHVREGPCPSSPAALTVPSKPPGAPKAVSIFGHDTVVDVQHDNEALPAPEVLEMRHLGEAQASPRHAQRLESEESGSLMRMLTAMMAWSPTHTPTTTERTDAASDQHGHSRRLHVEADAAPGSDGAPDAGGSRDHEGNHRGEQAAPQSVDDSEPDNSLVDDRSTLVDALPAEPDLAAAPRSSFECSDDRCVCMLMMPCSCT